MFASASLLRGNWDSKQAIFHEHNMTNEHVSWAMPVARFGVTRGYALQHTWPLPRPLRWCQCLPTNRSKFAWLTISTTLQLYQALRSKLATEAGPTRCYIFKRLLFKQCPLGFHLSTCAQPCWQASQSETMPGTLQMPLRCTASSAVAASMRQPMEAASGDSWNVQTCPKVSTQSTKQKQELDLRLPVPGHSHALETRRPVSGGIPRRPFACYTENKENHKDAL